MHKLLLGVLTAIFLIPHPVSLASGGLFQIPQMNVLCENHPEECAKSSVNSIYLTDEMLYDLIKINREVNASIRPKSDGLIDTWSIDVKEGDCEDYVFTKRKKLRLLGFDIGALRIATLQLSTGEGHAVLVVDTTQGQLILDNLTDKVKTRQETGYKFSLVSISGDPKIWIKQ